MEEWMDASGVTLCQHHPVVLSASSLSQPLHTRMRSNTRVAEIKLLEKITDEDNKDQKGKDESLRKLFLDNRTETNITTDLNNCGRNEYTTKTQVM